MDIKLEKKRGWRALLSKKSLPYAFGALLFVLLVWLLVKDNSSTLRVNTATISVSNVEEGEFNDYVSLSGTVQPITTMQLSPLESGVVERIVAEEGTTVKAGDVILEMANKQLSMQILQSEADLAEKQNILRNTLSSTLRLHARDVHTNRMWNFTRKISLPRRFTCSRKRITNLPRQGVCL